MGLQARHAGIVVCWLVGVVAVQAQVPAVGTPKGVLRVETDGLFGAFDQRFNNGTRESYAADLSSPALGSDRIPGIAALDARIGAIVGDPAFRLSLGRLTSDAHADISTAVLGLAFGVTGRLTAFGRLPLTSRRVQSNSRLDPSTGNAGLVAPPTEQAEFFNQFETALAALRTKLDAGDYNANPTRKALAEATLANGTSLHDNLSAILDDATSSVPFAPTASSAAGVAMANQIAALQTTLSTDLGVSGFSAGPVLPTESLTAEEFDAFVASLGYRPGQAQLRFRGDAELGLAFTVADRWDRTPGRGGFRAAASALVRLPTGTPPNPDRRLDLGSGDGQTDVEVGLVADMGSGRWGARATGTYVRQLKADIVRRVTPPSQPFVGPERRTLVEWDPGDIVALSLRPFYRLATTLAIQAGVDHWRHGADAVHYAATPIAEVDAAVLTMGSKASATSIGVGLTYANLGGLRPGGQGLPVEASWAFERVIGSGEGIVPIEQRVRASLRLYFRLF